MKTYNCYIVYREKDTLAGFPYVTDDIPDLKYTLAHCTTDSDVAYVFCTEDDPVVKRFNSLNDMNDYFNDSEFEYLIILRDGKWYCRMQGSNVFQEIGFKAETVDSKEKVGENNEATDEDVTNEGAEACLVSRANQLENELALFKAGYQKEQRLSSLTDLGLLLIDIIIIIMLFTQ